MKVPTLDQTGKLDRLPNFDDSLVTEGGFVIVRANDLAELERRYNGQREQIRKHIEFAREVSDQIDRGLGALGGLRERAYAAQGVGGGL